MFATQPYSTRLLASWSDPKMIELRQKRADVVLKEQHYSNT